MTKITSLLCAQLLAAHAAYGWGLRGHTLANLAAVEGIPGDGPLFLKSQKAYIGHLGTIPDTWRGVAEPFLRISEDANHSWYTEGFAFIPDPPRSRTEFILRVYDEYLKLKGADPERAKLLNIRYTGLQAYSIVEGYERMKAGMRLYRSMAIAPMYAAASPAFADREQVREILARDIAFYMGWLGHYVADAAMPLHDSIHHDGWSGPNPKNYTRDPNIHARFESQYVDLIAVTEADVAGHVTKSPRHLADPWKAALEHSLDARNYVEDVYKLDLRGAFRDKDDAEARQFTYRRLAAGASFLRDLAYTAWIESAKPVPAVAPADMPHSLANPRYNPAAGSAPALPPR
jgi:hypothetical protein